MTTDQITQIAYVFGLRCDVNSDQEVVVEVPRSYGNKGQERVIALIGSEGQDFKVVRNRSGRAVTFHPILKNS